MTAAPIRGIRPVFGLFLLAVLACAAPAHAKGLPGGVQHGALDASMPEPPAGAGPLGCSVVNVHSGVPPTVDVDLTCLFLLVPAP